MTKAERQREYQRRYRARCRCGGVTVRLEVPARVIEGLLVAGRLDDADSRDPAKLAAELADVLSQWSRVWLQNS
jgi:hypothetical protein